ncbi:alpha/beta fold hydrolase [Actomonas aquatica]|uniref:Alpha/beta fold hydrolase n=1 Tax=Actomonas aquatica TaxID=2866162 RepID=A0ABZ1C903_9BACT|nr:alpha/beta fold hydrolase [Opitutus sp. WL0086]WRQ87802.1 alpha/beta fold hydrolase [Opitutus sp. WL0086]
MTPLARFWSRTGPWLAAFCVCLAATQVSADETSRRAHLQWMHTALHDVPTWTAWQERTGELPPDFAELPSSEFLPDPLVTLAGDEVTDVAEWRERRAEILAEFQRVFWGQLPTKPAIEAVEALDEREEEGYRVRTVRLRFGPEGRGNLRVRITVPEGTGPFPAVLTTSLDGWSHHVVPRGYANIGFAGNDFTDDTANLGDLYPDYDFAALPRRAWAVQLVMDYVLSQPDIDGARVAIYGYSRDGKMATIAAALDERIAALIAGSTGVGGVLPWRLAGEFGMGEGIESTTMMFPHWFHPRMRFFVGHEDRLPVDANLLVAAIAPRACLLQYGLNDEVSNGWALERTYESALRAYGLFGAEERLGLLREPGFHGSIDPQRCLDWLDRQFGRSEAETAWDYRQMFAWDYAAWAQARSADAEYHGDTVREAVRWVLGEAPPQPPTPVPLWMRGPRPPAPGPTNGEGHGPGQLAPDVPAWVIGRGIQEFGWVDEDNAQVESVRLRFGNGLQGDLFWPRGAPEGERLPTVIWLHGYSYPLGYMWVYRRDLHPVLALVQAGYAVLAFDQSGFGSRQAEAGEFYERYPQWSWLGRMVEDVRAAVDVLSEQERVDPQRIGVLGYSVGGLVGLHAGALDERVAAVVSVGGFTPWRTSDGDVLRQLSEWHSLVPRLGRYAESPAQVPYDGEELIAITAPRPVLVVQPSMGRGADPVAVRQAVDRARVAYAEAGAGEALTLQEPEEYQRFTAAMQEEVIRWLNAQLR